MTMKHNWEYKRLGDVCTVMGGSTPKTNIDEYWDGNLNWFTPAEICENKYYSKSLRKITEKAVKETGLTLMPAGTVLLTSRAPIGKVGIAKEEFYCNQGFKNLICKDTLFNEYLYYTLLYFKYEIIEKGRGATFKEISKKVTEAIQIPVPPMEVQKQIVEELDKINEIIEDCRELLRNLNALAQSLFYDFFGDPVTNSKGWQTQILSEIAPQHPYKGKFSVDDDLWLLNLDMIEKNTGRIINRHKVKYEDIGNSVYKIGPNQVLYSKLRPNLNKVVIADDFGYCTSELLPLNPQKGLLNCQYLAYLLRTKECVTLFSGKVAGAKMPRTDLKTFRTFQIPIPPFELQEKFSARIEQIEAEKKTVEEMIANLQVLLDSRMDYWFN